MEQTPRRQKIVVLSVCSVFIGVGLLIFIPTCLLPVLDFLEMRKWKETPCTILRSPFAQGAERSRVVVYAYELDDVLYESENPGLDGMFSPLRSTWDFRPGYKTRCFVNPRDRREAALWRDLDATILFGCAPLLFVFLPGLGLVMGWRNIGRPPPPEPPPVPEGPAAPSAVLASTRGSRGCSVLVTLFFLAFLGGILFVLWTFGHAGHLLIGLPFGFVWLLLLRLLGRLLLSLLNPRVVLRTTPGRGAPGGALDVRWDIVGGLRGVRRFVLELVVREEHSTRSGKRSTTRTSPLSTVEIARGGTKELRRGSTRITLPQTMHSFRHGGVAIVWAFRLTAEIPFGPDVADEFPFEVGPACL